MVAFDFKLNVIQILLCNLNPISLEFSHNLRQGSESEDVEETHYNSLILDLRWLPLLLVIINFIGFSIGSVELFDQFVRSHKITKNLSAIPLWSKGQINNT